MIHEVPDQQGDWWMGRSISKEFNELNRIFIHLTACLQSTEHKTMKVKLCEFLQQKNVYNITERS
jgi:hypothetical protein